MSVVVFIVTEQKQITSIAFRGNQEIRTDTLQETVDIRAGQAIDLPPKHPTRNSGSRRWVDLLDDTFAQRGHYRTMNDRFAALRRRLQRCSR